MNNRKIKIFLGYFSWEGEEGKGKKKKKKEVDNYVNGPSGRSG